MDNKIKAVILAAGRGKRLIPLTKSIPKVMIPVLGKPVLEHHIEKLAKSGIREIYVNLHHLPETITTYFKDGKKWNVNIHYSFEPELLGTAGAIKKLQRELENNPFIVVYGDNFINVSGYGRIITQLKTKGLGSIGIFKKDKVENSGVVIFNTKSEVVEFIEKPSSSITSSNWVNAGFYYFNPEIFKYIPEGYSDFGYDIFPLLLKKGKKLFCYKLEAEVYAIDDIDQLEETKKVLE